MGSRPVIAELDAFKIVEAERRQSGGGKPHLAPALLATLGFQGLQFKGHGRAVGGLDRKAGLRSQLRRP